MRKIISGFFLILLLVKFFSGTIYAASPRGSLEVSPAYTEVVLESPTDTKKIVISYKNNSQKPLALDIFPIDFKQAEGTGVINFLGTESGSFSYSLSSFLSFEANSLQLGPGEQKDFVVTVSNREDLSPGGHYAAVVAKIASDQNEGVIPQVSPSVSALILLRKTGGERFNLSLTQIDYPKNSIVFGYPKTITATFENEGNIHLVPFGNAEIKDMFGRVIYRGVINTGSLRVFPESRRYIYIDMQKISWSLPLSINTITVNGEDSLGKISFKYKDTFLYINLYFVIFIIICLVGFLISKKKKSKTKPATPSIIKSKQKRRKK